MWAAGLLAASVVLALLARPHSTGSRLRAAAAGYMEMLAGGRPGEAHRMMSDSLRRTVSPAMLDLAAPQRPVPPARLGGREAGAYRVGFRSADGTTRTVWLRLGEGDASVVGDSRLEAVMGGARELCIGYARSSVVPAVLGGAAASDYSCPVTGLAYGISAGGALICPAGHLGTGVVFSGDACAARRDSLAGLAGRYVARRGSLPGSFPEMYAELDLPPRSRVGYSCPSDANAFYAILPDSTIRCSYHGESTPVEVPQ